MLRATLKTAVALVVVSVLAVPGSAIVCTKQDGCWTSTNRVTEWTGSPTIPCLIGHPVVRIESEAECRGYTAGPTVVLRCGDSSEGFKYSGGHGSTHKIGTTSDWETVLWGACSDLTYEAN